MIQKVTQAFNSEKHLWRIYSKIIPSTHPILCTPLPIFVFSENGEGPGVGSYLVKSIQAKCYGDCGCKSQYPTRPSDPLPIFFENGEGLGKLYIGKVNNCRLLSDDGFNNQPQESKERTNGIAIQRIVVIPSSQPFLGAPLPIFVLSEYGEGPGVGLSVQLIYWIS